MKNVIVIGLSLALFSTSAFADRYHYHRGSGNDKGWYAVGGAVLGYALARERYKNDDTYALSDDSYDNLRAAAIRVCKRMSNPYTNNRPAAEAWIRGCAERKIREQQEIERRAYEEGIQGD